MAALATVFLLALAALAQTGQEAGDPFEDTFVIDEIQADKYLNRMIDYMYEDDRSSILVVLQLFSIMPLFKIRWTMSLIESGSSWKGMLGAPFRMLRIALKGLIFTVYYSDMTEDQVIHKKIGYDAKIIM